MRHNKKFNHLGRKKGHREALLRNMSMALVQHKRIFTTLAKAKALKMYIEPLVTKAKNDTQHNRRVVFSYLQDNKSVSELFGPIAAEVGDRPGGYLRVIRTGFRLGDGAQKAMIEFVDFNKDYTSGDTKKSRRTRRGRGRKKKTVATTNVANKEEE